MYLVKVYSQYELTYINYVSIYGKLIKRIL